MSRLMSVIWVFQFWFLLAASVICIVWPEGMVKLTTGCVDAPKEEAKELATFNHCWKNIGQDDSGPWVISQYTGQGLPVEGPHLSRATSAERECPKACYINRDSSVGRGLFARVRLISPYLFALALLSLHAVMRGDERLRRSLAAVFAVIYVFLAQFVYTEGYTEGFAEKFSSLSLGIGDLILCASLLAFAPFSAFKAFRASYRTQRLAMVCIFLGYLLVFILCLITPFFIWVEPSTRLSLIYYVLVFLLVIDLVIGGFELLLKQLFTLAAAIPAAIILLHHFEDVIDGKGDQLANNPIGTRVIVYATVLLTFAHVLYSLWPGQAAARKLSGSANTLPSTLWVFWLLQGTFFFAFLGALSWLRDGAHWGGYITTTNELPDLAYKVVYQQIDTLFHPLLIGMGLLSFIGMRTSREWFWKAQCMLFAATNAFLLVVMALVWDDRLYEPWWPFMSLPAMIFLGVHLWFYLTRQRWHSEEVGEGPDGWTVRDLVVGPIYMLKTLFSARRATHARGAAAVGRLELAFPERQGSDAPRAPEHELFTPQGNSADKSEVQFDVHLRFSNEGVADDASADARGAALRLWLPDRSPFDLLFSTGSYSTAENILEYGLVVAAKALGRRGRRWLTRVPHFREGIIAGLRRAPSSYTQLCYYSQVVRFWVATNHERYLVRYRLVPEAAKKAGWKESGLEVTRDDFINRERKPGEYRPTDYLRRDLKLLLEGDREVKLQLQAQFHNMTEQGNGIQWYNPAVDWSETDHPWRPLATLTLLDVISDKEAEALCFNPDNAPISLGTPVSPSFLDYRSIGDVRRRVMRRVQMTRQWMTDTFGTPSSAPVPVKSKDLSL